MTVFTQGQLFQFNLNQTAALLPALANCVAVVKQQGIANAGDFSVKLAPGIYTVLLRLDPKKLPDGLKLSSGDVNFLLN